jgi:hypothetical protein
MSQRALALVVPNERVQERFWEKVDMEGECWLWLAATRSTDGIGVFGYEGKIVYAHRLAWVIAKGALPAGFEVQRSCGNGLCVRPRHLVLVSSKKTKIVVESFADAPQDWLM